MAQLSPTSRATKILIADPLSDGYQIQEIASSLGQPPSWVSERLRSLREELLLASGHFFPLTEHEYQALEASILAQGIQVEILLGRHLTLIDGRHRALIAQKHRLEAPCRLLTGLSAEEEQNLAVALNAARRQLTRAQRRTLVQAELMRNPARSDRLIAAICGVHWDTVGVIRAEIAEQQRSEVAESAATPLDELATWKRPINVTETVYEPGTSALEATVESANAEFPRARVDPPIRIDSRGGSQNRPEPLQPLPTPDLDKPLGHADCAHGQRHAIYKDGPGYRLEGQ